MDVETFEYYDRLLLFCVKCMGVIIMILTMLFLAYMGYKNRGI